MRRAAAILAVLATALLAAAPASAEPPWQGADGLRADLFEAQADLLFGERTGSSVAAAEERLAGPLRRGLAAEAPDELAEVEASLRAARRAAAQLDEAGLAAARGRIVSALRRGAFAVAVAAARRGDAAEARAWLQIRDFRQTTRFTRPGVDATAAVEGLASGEVSPRETVVQIEKDLLDAFQARLASNLDEAAQAAERGFDGRFAETAAIARGYWLALAPEYAEQRDAGERRATDRDFERLAAAAAAADRAGFEAARKRVEADLEGFTAAPLTPDEQVNRAAQLTRFLDLVPKEFDKGTADGRVTIPFEIQEAVAFMDGVETAFADLEPVLLDRDPAAVARIKAAHAELRADVDAAQQGGAVAAQEELDAARDSAADAFEGAAPQEWTEPGEEADYELVDISLDQLEAAAGAGQYSAAEQARLAAYGFFEFGPELKLRAFDPQLALKIEGLIWYGADGNAGLAQLVADKAPVGEIRDTRLTLDEELTDARALTGDGGSATTAIVNSALIVFREGLEAILILAAITASMIGPRAPLRRPVYRGALLALPASMLMFLLALLLLDSLSQYGEKLEAVVGVVAIGVLLLVMNWFFHRVYWTEWIKGHRQRGKALTGAALATGAGAATVAGLYTLGFTSVFREGFETVLFLQALAAQLGHRRRPRRRLARPGDHGGGRRRHLRARAPSPLQEDAGGDGGADRPRPRRPGRQHGADDAGRRLAADPSARRRIPALDGHLARHLPHRRDARGAGARLLLRGRQLLRCRVDAQARAAAGDRGQRGVGAGRGGRVGGTGNRVRGRCRRDSGPRPHSPLTRSSSATPGGRCCSPRSCSSSRR